MIPLRQSTINMILRCPHQYEMLHTYGRVPPGIAAISGSATHEAAEYNHVQKVKSGRDEPLEVLQDCADQKFRDRLMNEGLYILEEERPSLQRIIEDGRQRTKVCTEIYHKHVAPKIQPVEEFTEKKIEVEIAGVLLQGTFDTADAKDNIFDFKTSASKYQERYIRRAIQPTHYSLMYYKKKGKFPTFHTEILVQNGEHQPLEVTKTEADFEKHLNLCRTVLKIIESGLFPPCNPDPKCSWWCAPKWCGWYSLCEYT